MYIRSVKRRPLSQTCSSKLDMSKLLPAISDVRFSSTDVSAGEVPQTRTSSTQKNLVSFSSPDGVFSSVPSIETFQNLTSAFAPITMLQQGGISKPNTLQKHLLPLLFNEKALIVRACTGMGKTTSILLYIAMRMRRTGMSKHSSCVKNISFAERRQYELAPQVLLVTGSVERVEHMRTSFRKLFKGDPWKEFSLFPGADPERQYHMMGKTGCDVVISTPCRLKYFIDEDMMLLKSVKCVVLDEADIMIQQKMHFAIESIFQYVPVESARFVFAQKYTQALQAFVKRNFPMKTPRLEVGYVPQVKYEFHVANSDFDKLQLITKLLQDRTIDSSKRVLIFTNKRESTKESMKALFDRLCVVTRSYQIFVRLMTCVSKRTEAASFMSTGKGRILIVPDTSIISSCPSVDIVINFSLPASLAEYEERCAYPERYGADGAVYTLFDRQQNPAVVRDIVSFIEKKQLSVPENLRRLVDEMSVSFNADIQNERKKGTMNTFDWIRQTAREGESGKPVKTFVRATPPGKSSTARNPVMATISPRSKGKGLPSIRF